MPPARQFQADADASPAVASAGVGQAVAAESASFERTQKRFYFTPGAKFTIACAIAIAWTAFSVWPSLTWLHELATVTSLAFAVIAITFIAYVPGFMNAFLLSTLSLDRKPARRVPDTYPGASILVAAYNEAAAI